VTDKMRKLSQKMLRQLESDYLMTNELLHRLEEYKVVLEGRMDFVKGMLDD